MKTLVCLLLLAGWMYSQETGSMPEMKQEVSKAPAVKAGGKAEIQKKADEWRQGFKAKDADKVAAMYTDDAVWINAEGTFHGHEEIKNELKKMIDRGDTVDSIVTTRSSNSPELGFAEGTYSGKAPNPKTGAQQPGHGQWVVTVKNANGQWMIATHTSVPSMSAKPK